MGKCKPDGHVVMKIQFLSILLAAMISFSVIESYASFSVPTYVIFIPRISSQSSDNDVMVEFCSKSGYECVFPIDVSNIKKPENKTDTQIIFYMSNKTVENPRWLDVDESDRPEYGWFQGIKYKWSEAPEHETWFIIMKDCIWYEKLYDVLTRSGKCV